MEEENKEDVLSKELEEQRKIVEEQRAALENSNTTVEDIKKRISDLMAEKEKLLSEKNDLVKKFDEQKRFSVAPPRDIASEFAGVDPIEAIWRITKEGGIR